MLQEDVGHSATLGSLLSSSGWRLPMPGTEKEQKGNMEGCSQATETWRDSQAHNPPHVLPAHPLSSQSLPPGSTVCVLYPNRTAVSGRQPVVRGPLVVCEVRKVGSRWSKWLQCHCWGGQGGKPTLSLLLNEGVPMAQVTAPLEQHKSQATASSSGNLS